MPSSRSKGPIDCHIAGCPYHGESFLGLHRHEVAVGHQRVRDHTQAHDGDGERPLPGHPSLRALSMRRSGDRIVASIGPDAT